MAALRRSPAANKNWGTLLPIRVEKFETHNFTWCLCARAYARLFIHIMHRKVSGVSGVGASDGGVCCEDILVAKHPDLGLVLVHDSVEELLRSLHPPGARVRGNKLLQLCDALCRPRLLCRILVMV